MWDKPQVYDTDPARRQVHKTPGVLPGSLVRSGISRRDGALGAHQLFVKLPETVLNTLGS